MGVVATLTVIQAEALQSFIAKRDAAMAGMAEVFAQVGLDPAQPYQVNWVTRELAIPQMAEQPLMELVPANRAARRRIQKGNPDGSQPQDN